MVVRHVCMCWQVYSRISLSDILLIVFAVLGVGVLVVYALLQYLVERARELDATRHLREHQVRLCLCLCHINKAQAADGEGKGS